MNALRCGIAQICELLALLLLVPAGFGQTIPNVQWDVPYVGQLDYRNWGQSACGPTSITMLLKFWYPNSAIEIPEVYHAATQQYTYNGPLYWYRNVGWKINQIAPRTEPDTIYERVTVPIPSALRPYYHGGDAPMVWENAVAYLRSVWGGNATIYSGHSLASLLQKLPEGPIVTGVNEGSGGHIVLVTGYEKDLQGVEWVIFNEPYYPYTRNDGTPTKDRKIRRSTFNGWYTNRDNIRYITYTPLSYYGKASDAPAWDIRQNTVVVDNGSLLLDEVKQGNTVPEPVRTNFRVDNLQGKMSSGQFVWWLYHQNGTDYAYAKEGGHSVRWTPDLKVSGFYLVKVRSHKRTDSSVVNYAVKSLNGKGLGGSLVDQWAATAGDAGPFERLVGMYWLDPGSYVEVANLPATTAADTVVFEYVSPYCENELTSALEGKREASVSRSEECPVPPPPSNPVELYANPLFSDPSLVAYYRMEGNGNDSKGQNNGEIDNVIFSGGMGRFGKGGGFAGANSKISLGLTPADLQLTSFTIAAWIYTAGGAKQGIMNFGSSNAPYFRVNSNNTLCLVKSNVLDIATSTSTIPTGQWAHVAVTYTASGDYNFYINGVNAGSGRVPEDFSFPSETYIGVADSISEWFHGSIDDLAAFSRPLDAAEIVKLYNGGLVSGSGSVIMSVAGFGGSISCLLNNVNVKAPAVLNNQAAGNYALACTPPAGYKISAITPSATQDLSSGGVIGFTVSVVTTASNPLELYQTPLFLDSSLKSYYRFEGGSVDTKSGVAGVDSDVTYGLSSGRFGQGVGLIAASSRVAIGNPPSLQISGAQTVSFWFKSNGITPAHASILYKGGIDSAVDINWGVFQYYFGSTNYYFSFQYSDGSNMALLELNKAQTDAACNNAWHHFAMVYVPGVSATVFQDGVVLVQKTSNIPSFLATDRGFAFGQIDYDQSGHQRRSMVANLDDVAIFSRALTPDEIAMLYGSMN